MSIDKIIDEELFKNSNITNESNVIQPLQEDLNLFDRINQYNKSIVAKIYKSIGIEEISECALAYSSDIFASYSESLLKLVHSYSELSARTKPNMNDVRMAFQDMGVSINEILEYMERIKESNTMPCNEIKEIKPEIDEFVDRPHKILADEKLDDFPEYIPKYLPKFPHQYTYMNTSIRPKRTEDPSRIRQLNIQQSRTVEGNLKKLMLHKEKNEDLIPIVNYEIMKMKQNRTKNVL